MNDDVPSASSAGASAPEHGLASTAARGTTWTSAQAIINKLATIGAMWVVALRLTPDEFGLASLTLAVGVFLVILPPMTVGDVLVTHRKRFELIAPIAARLAVTVAVATTLLIALAAPVIGIVFDKFPTAILIGLVWVVSLRPIGDGIATVALSRLRVNFHYRTIAIIDGSTQLVATLATVVMAFSGCSALSLVLPQVVAMFAKALWYRSKQRAEVAHAQPLVARPSSWHHARIRKSVIRQFVLAASAQYVHNVLVLLPALVLGYFASEEQTGLYAFAFMLSAQANGLIAAQLGTVLQPIFVRLGASATRQADGFLRVVRVIGAVAVPVCLLQAAVAEPLFTLVFPAKWNGAITIFAVLSILEGFYFATAPTMALMRAQGRFGTYFIWQSTQFAISACAYIFAASHHGAIGVALCAAVLWGMSLPIALWLCVRRVGGTLWSSLAVMFAPWMTALPVALAVWGAWNMLSRFDIVGMLVTLFAVAPLGFVVAFWLTRFSQPTAYRELVPLVKKVITRVVSRA